MFGLNHNPEHYKFAVTRELFQLQMRHSWLRGQILLLGGLQLTNCHTQTLLQRFAPIIVHHHLLIFMSYTKL